MDKRKRRRSRKNRKNRESAEPTLFDLPLHGNNPNAGEASSPEQAPATGRTGQGPSILFDTSESGTGNEPQLGRLELAGKAELPEPAGVLPEAAAAGDKLAGDEAPRDKAPRDKVAGDEVAGDEVPAAQMLLDEAPRDAPADDEAFLGDRLLGGLADLAAQLIALGLVIAAVHSMGIVVTVADWMPFGVLALVFSFLYWVMPLAFWGQTPGMAWVGHTARSSSGEPLSFGQTFLRWLGSILTLAFAGLPLLIALTGRSLTDRISGSRTTATNR